MRVEFDYEMTNELAQMGNALLLRHQLRGVSWQSAVFWFLVAVAVLLMVSLSGMHWAWVVLSAIGGLLFFVVLLLVLGIPRLHEVRLRRYLDQIATWPHRRVKIALTPDIIELTTPSASGLFERQDLTQVIRDQQVTALLFRGGFLVPVWTSEIPEAAWQLLGMANEGASQHSETSTGGGSV